MGIIWTGLAPHPPIIVPSVGRERCREAQATIDAMRQLCADLVQHAPQRLILISPHAPRPHQGIYAWAGPEIHGDLGQFDAPATRFKLAVDQAWITSLEGSYPSLHFLSDEPLDHGTMVPLFFAVEAGWQGQTCVLSLPWNEGEGLDQLGDAIAAACNDNRPTALLASGDMSHCLRHDGPYGFNANGPRFDSSFVTQIKNGHYRGATLIDANLRHNAKQDVLESCRVAWQASGYNNTNRQFYSYEGPFGVGYTVMKFYSEHL